MNGEWAFALRAQREEEEIDSEIGFAWVNRGDTKTLFLFFSRRSKEYVTLRLNYGGQ